jgi:hypothetical protein
MQKEFLIKMYITCFKTGKKKKKKTNKQRSFLFFFIHHHFWVVNFLPRLVPRLSFVLFHDWNNARTKRPSVIQGRVFLLLF